MFAAIKFNSTPRKLRREKTTLSSSSESEKEPVHVYCRLRPLPENVETSCVKLISPQDLCLVCESKGTRKQICYKFKHIFTSYASQKEVFDHIAYPLLSDLLQGKNGLLLTYGLTGSGKTYTLTGEQNNPGIMPRCIDTIFNSIGELQAPKFVIKSDKINGFELQAEDDALQDRMAEIRSKRRAPRSNRKINTDKINYCNDGTKIPLLNDTSIYAVFVSYIEIYNNNVYDLLDESNGKTLQNKILREDSQGNMYVNGVVEVEVKNAQDAFELFNAGQKRKKMGWTALNAESSRSHSIFNIRVVQLEQISWNNEGKPIIPEKNLLTVGQLSLVDMAGSERTNRTQNTGTRLKEASSINNSLMTLRTCMETLRKNQHTKNNKMVPYRDSRLTYLFKNYFEGNGSIQMIVCVNPSLNDFEENLHVMKFPEMSQDVKITKSSSKSAVKKVITKDRIRAKVKNSGFTILPEITVCKFDSGNMEEMGTSIDKIIEVFKQRKTSKSKSEIRSCKRAIKKQRQKMSNLEVKIRDLQMTNSDLISKQEELQDMMRSLYNTINEKDLKLNQNILEKEPSTSRQQSQVQLQKVREILNNETIMDTVERTTTTESAITQTPKSHTSDLSTAEI